jgi:flagellar protein FlgJ
MADSISLLKIPFAIADILYSKDSLQRSLKPGKAQAADKPDPQLRNACSKMESLFIYHLLKEMRSTIDKSGFISGGRAEEIYTSMLDSEMAKEASERGGIGLADLLLRQLENRRSQVDEEGTD